MWVLGDRSGPILEEVVLSFETEYAFLNPEIFIKAIEYLKVLVNGVRKGHYAEDNDPTIVGTDGRLREPLFPCTLMKSIRIRMIEDEGAPEGVRAFQLVLPRIIKVALSDLVERGVEVSIARTGEGCIFV